MTNDVYRRINGNSVSGFCLPVSKILPSGGLYSLQTDLIWNQVELCIYSTYVTLSLFSI